MLEESSSTVCILSTSPSSICKALTMVALLNFWPFSLGVVVLTLNFQGPKAFSFRHVGHASIQQSAKIHSSRIHVHNNFDPSMHSTLEDEHQSKSSESSSSSAHHISSPTANTTHAIEVLGKETTNVHVVTDVVADHHTSPPPNHQQTIAKKEPEEPIPRRPLVRLIDNIWFILCTPFPDLRKLSRKRENDSKFVASIRLRDGFAAVLAYLALGVVSYRYIFEKWSFIDSLYFTCCTFATIGYGDVVAKTVAGKFFSCIFGISGIALLGAAVARIGSRLVQAEIDAVKTARQQSQRRILQVYDRMPKAVLKMRRASHKNHNRVMHEARELLASIPHPQFPPFLTTFWKAARYIIQSLTVVALGGLVIGYLEGWKWYDSIYYGLITGTSKGTGRWIDSCSHAEFCASRHVTHTKSLQTTVSCGMYTCEL